MVSYLQTFFRLLYSIVAPLVDRCFATPLRATIMTGSRFGLSEMPFNSMPCFSVVFQLLQLVPVERNQNKVANSTSTVLFLIQKFRH